MSITIKHSARCEHNTRYAAGLALAIGLIILPAQPVRAEPPPTPLGFGHTISPDELTQFVSPLPDGRGLPKGAGTVMQGEKVYTQHCLACHGANLEGGIGDRLTGGRGSLVNNDPTKAPIKTVESYWPYATTLFDYIKRSMPFTQPGSLSNDDVYAVSAYILHKANILPGDASLNQDTLANVEMPNRNGFKPAGR
jgi:cytochrome c